MHLRGQISNWVNPIGLRRLGNAELTFPRKAGQTQVRRVQKRGKRTVRRACSAVTGCARGDSKPSLPAAFSAACFVGASITVRSGSSRRRHTPGRRKRCTRVGALTLSYGLHPQSKQCPSFGLAAPVHLTGRRLSRTVRRATRF